MEEERARQEAATGKPAAETKAPAASAAAKPAVVADEDDMLAQAIAMSMMVCQGELAQIALAVVTLIYSYPSTHRRM